MQPLYFGPPDAPLFGCWHAPSAPVLDLGVLLCPSFGREEVSGHRTLRHLAQRLASQGVGVLRFDYFGTGDSAGDESAARLVEAWQSSVDAAIDELRRLSGARRLAIAGLRLGVLLGAAAAARRADVSDLVAFAPVTSGRAFVREQKVLQAASAVPGLAPPEADLLEAGGYPLHAATREALSALDLRKLDTPPARRVLVIDRDDMPPSNAWLMHLSAGGADVEHLYLPGYPGMMLDPHNTVVPEVMLEAATQWLIEPAGRREAPAPAVSVPERADLDGVVEQAVTIDAAGRALCGILSQPQDLNRPPRKAVLLVNAGAQRRIGPSRAYVTLARRLAVQGVLVLRLDLSGLGDSAPAPGAQDNVVYSPTALQEIDAAVRYLRSVAPVDCCMAVGLCSGAYHAFKAAVHGTPVEGVIAINPLTFFWHEGTPLDAPLPAYKVAAEMARYRSNLLSGERWRKLLKGQVDMHRLGTLLWRRLLQTCMGPARELARLLHLPLRDDLARELSQVAAAGVALRFVFAEGDPGEELLRNEGGSLVNRLLQQGALVIDRIPDADHTFTGSLVREQLLELLVRCIGA